MEIGVGELKGLFSFKVEVNCVEDCWFVVVIGINKIV